MKFYNDDQVAIERQKIALKEVKNVFNTISDLIKKEFNFKFSGDLYNDITKIEKEKYDEMVEGNSYFSMKKRFKNESIVKEVSEYVESILKENDVYSLYTQYQTYKSDNDIEFVDPSKVIPQYKEKKAVLDSILNICKANKSKDSAGLYDFITKKMNMYAEDYSGDRFLMGLEQVKIDSKAILTIFNTHEDYLNK